MTPDAEGFLQPAIDPARCIHCGTCESACPVLAPRRRQPDAAYLAARAMSEPVRRGSSSGGVFPLLARAMLLSGGVVYGARQEFPSGQVRHVRVDREDRLPRLWGSKYLQSRMDEALPMLARDVDEGRKALFSGTPCQVAALFSFLGRRPDDLVAAEVICHGVPSHELFLDYRNDVIPPGKRDGVSGFLFRDKRVGWAKSGTCWQFRDGAPDLQASSDLFLRAFSLDLVSRPSCHRCRFRDGASGSDLTLGDFWEGEVFHPDWDDETGISAVVVRSPRGKALLDAASSLGLDVRPSRRKDILAANSALVRDFPPNRARALFFRLRKHMRFSRAVRLALGIDGFLSLPRHLRPSALRERWKRLLA
jgi:ferredoxin